MEAKFFLPEEPSLSLEEAVARLGRLSGRQRDRWFARLMRELPPSRFFRRVAPAAEVNARYEALRPLLGRDAALWDWVILGARRQGLLGDAGS